MKKIIAIITSEYGIESGGLSYSCYDFSKMLEEFGYKTEIISSTGNASFENSGKEIKQHTKKVTLVKGGYKKELWDHLYFKSYLHNVYQALKSQDLHMIIAFGAGENGLFASELALLLHVNLILLLRGSEINLSISDMSLREMNRIAISRSKRVVGLSGELIYNSKNIYYDTNILFDVIPIAIKEPSEIQVGFNKDYIKLGCGAHHLNEKKGVGNLIDTIHHLNKQSKITFELELAGNIDNDLLTNYKKLSRNLGVENYIKFIGGQSRQEFIESMDKWDFYVQASFGEGFSNSIAEYLSLGKAFILSSTGFIAEKLKDGFQKILFDDFIPENMAKKILNLVESDNLQTLYQNAYKTIIPITNETLIKEKWCNVLAIANSRNPRPLNANIFSIVFHDISQQGFSNIDVPLDAFKDFVERVAAKGYILCSSSSYFNSKKRSNLIVCTFDDGYENVYNLALPILSKYNFTATVFICHNNIGGKNDWNLKDKKKRNHLNSEQLLEMKRNEWEIGSHGMTHSSLLKLTDEEITDELIISKKKLEKLFGEVKAYAYPYGDFNEFIKAKAAKIYDVAYSLNKGGTLIGIDNYQIRRYFLSDITTLLVKDV